MPNLAMLLLVSSSLSIFAQPGPTIATTSHPLLKLRWKPSPSPNVSGYYLCWGLVSGQCTNLIDAGSVTKVNLTGLSSGSSYFFTVIAYSSFGDEAPPSNEVSYSQPNPPNRPPHWDAIGDLTVGGRLRNNFTTRTFTVTVAPGNVLDYLSVHPGVVAVEAGSAAALPLHLVSSDPLANVTFTVSWPSDKFVNPSLTLADGSIFTGLTQVQDTNLLINLAAAAGKTFVGSNIVGTLNFTASSNQLSAFIPIRTAILSGTKANSEPFVDLFPGFGEVVLVGDHPLLRALAPTASTRILNLYGQVGASYRVLYTTNMLPNPVWQLLTTYTQTNEVQSLTLDSSAPFVFYRLEKQ